MVPSKCPTSDVGHSTIPSFNYIRFAVTIHDILVTALLPTLTKFVSRKLILTSTKSFLEGLSAQIFDAHYLLRYRCQGRPDCRPFFCCAMFHYDNLTVPPVHASVSSTSDLTTYTGSYDNNDDDNGIHRANDYNNFYMPRVRARRERGWSLPIHTSKNEALQESENGACRSWNGKWSTYKYARPVQGGAFADRFEATTGSNRERTRIRTCNIMRSTRPWPDHSRWHSDLHLPARELLPWRGFVEWASASCDAPHRSQHHCRRLVTR
jgi:hypothetical protein